MCSLLYVLLDMFDILCSLLYVLLNMLCIYVLLYVLNIVSVTQ